MTTHDNRIELTVPSGVDESTPMVFPVPRVMDVSPTGHFTGVIIEGVDPSLPPQGYEIELSEDRGRFTYADEAGRRYGQLTLQQLGVDRASDSEEAGDTGEVGDMPLVHIRDWPDIPVRGFMLDVSRDRVPTRASLERQVSILSVARYNHLQLYIEHTFAYEGHEDVWSGCSPITADDLEWLDKLCARNGIELAANQNCFGHMGKWLAHERYKMMADSPDGAQVSAGFTVLPTVLAPTEQNADFVVGLVREQMALLRSETVNIGCDETFELGRGESAARADQIGIVGVYVEHLNRIAQPLLNDGASVLFWGDVIAADPARMADLPEAGSESGGITALVWNYDAPDALTPELPTSVLSILDELDIDMNSPTDFESRVAFAESDVPFWVSPGTSTWNSFIGRWANARSNLADAAITGRDHGSGGFLVTDWGDNGHHQPPSVSDLPTLYGGAVSWCAESNSEVDVATVANEFLYRDPAGVIGRVLDRVGRLDGETGRVARNDSPLFAAMFPHQMHLVGGRTDPTKLANTIGELESAIDDLAGAQPECVDARILLEELSVAIGLAHHGALRMAREVDMNCPDDDWLRDDLGGLIGQYRDVWLERSRPGGLNESIGHLEQTLSGYN
ncbi:MAG: hypothetical protein R2735_11315 [Microthrixaceae bacterium]